MRSAAASAGLGALIVGASGFCAGFFGPLALNPDANQGPLVGILITGPGGVLIGAVLGAVLGAIGVSDKSAAATLSVVAALLGVGTLFPCLPEPAYKASIIRFEVVKCQAPAELKAEALADWDKRVAAVTWSKPRDGWKEEFDAAAAKEPGAVLTVKLTGNTTVLVNRRPWNKGTIVAGPGRKDLPGRYFLRGASCANLPPDAGGPWVTKQDPSKLWPPENLTGLLGLLTLEDVPASYAGLPLQ